ncbi:F-box/WD repeat-containing protein 4-like isoform X1 [Uloborus diversus]|uniref:F-box/WD repeat-containing protein 4-like isoform X1 n=1 Tax=Uloborus diversus TaxID=327109 RepID=UPI002409D1D1|nr:F-box/WD repeat-containing protein 4-like isoform X1 [Uloborus diversus]
MMCNSESFHIFSFPLEILTKIIVSCDLKSIARLSQTCRYFRDLLQNDFMWLHHSKFALGSNLLSPRMRERSPQELSFKMRCITGLNWRKCNSKKFTLFMYRKALPIVKLDQECLVLVAGKTLLKYNRCHKTGAINGKSFSKCIWDELSGLVINKDEVVTIGCCGSLARWKKKNLHLSQMCKKSNAYPELTAVDAKSDIIVSGSRNGYLQVWKTMDNNTKCISDIQVVNKVLSVALHSANSKFIVGLRGTDNIHPLQLYDLEKSSLITKIGSNFKHGAGILSIYPECENTFLSGSYDTSIRLWDVRDPRKSVLTWTEPFDNTIYCVTSDHHVTILSGANRSSMVHFWDKRHSNMVNFHCEKAVKFSPVYSIAFDACQEYVAYDEAIFQYSYS